ncbi:AAA family ATPase [Pseudomonas syringae pv. actinidiae]|nr:AAA family ATPase [Pseudomonas syringae pv. actinidiae]NVL37061.1 AAA family ATPase [Pseudomonas syringae pv. actinidiae]NVL51024.1 AAA family ATPase [Pseudomonas syringae pv. actinidiae]
MALCGVIGSGKTVMLRRLQQVMEAEKKITVSKSLAIEKHSIKLATFIAALYYDLSTEKQVRIPTQGEKRERDLRELVKKNKRPVALFVDEAHDLNGHTLTGLKRLMELVEDGDGRLGESIFLPEQRQGDAGTARLSVYPRPVRHRPLIAWHGWSWWE